MRVSGHNVKVNNISNTYKTCRVLNFMLSVFGLYCNVHRNSKLMLIRIFLSIIVLGALLVFVIYYKANHINKVLNKSVTATDTVQNIYDYFQYIIDLFYVYKYGGHVYCEYFKQYSTIDDIIGREKDINLIKNRLSKLSVIFITIWLLNSICDFVAWSLTFGWKTPLIYSPSYLYLLIRMVTNLDTICQILNIQCRMRVIYNIVHDSYESADSLSVTICDTIQNKNWFYNRKTPDSTHKKITPQEYNRDKQLSKCYLLLTEQCAYINQMFGFRILLNTFSSFIDMVRFTNLTVRMIVGTQLIQYESICFPIASTICRMLTCVLIFVSLIINCENTYRENERIIYVIDHMFINKNPGPELRASMSELRDLMQSRPVNFHLANFFRVDYSLLMSTASVVATYSIILLQSVN